MKHEASNRKAMTKAQPTIKKSGLKTAVTAAKFLEKKAAPSKKKIKPVIAIQKVKPSIKKNISKKIVLVSKPIIKKAEVVAPVKTAESKTVRMAKPKIQKLKTASPVGRIKSAEKKVKPNKAVKIIKPKTKAKPVTVTTAVKSKARKLKTLASAKKIKAVGKKTLLPVSKRLVKKTSVEKSKLNASEKLTKFKVQKPKTNVSIKKAKTADEKNKQNNISQKTKLPTKKNKSAKSVQADKPKLQKTKPVILGDKISGKKTNVKSASSNKNFVAGKLKSKGKQIKPTVSAKTVKTKEAKTLKAKAQKIKLVVPVKKAKTDENKIKPTIQPLEKKLKRKKTRPIGAAVFRGQKSRYDFKVFPLDNDFEDVSAIYVISRRKIDRQKKGHHALVCIGQTDSVSGEIKRHKIKCIKRHNANVISILPEADLKKRLKIEEDLKSAHALACNIG